jgi:hypothetical protein
VKVSNLTNCRARRVIVIHRFKSFRAAKSDERNWLILRQSADVRHRAVQGSPVTLHRLAGLFSADGLTKEPWQKRPIPRCKSFNRFSDYLAVVAALWHSDSGVSVNEIVALLFADGGVVITRRS